MESVEDQFNNIRTEWHVLKEKWFYGEAIDPVFEGMVKDFCVFDLTMQDTFRKVETFMKGVDHLAEGLLTLADCVTGGLSRVDDALIVADSCKLKEATNQITRADAPHSAIAKLRRDMDFNIMNPIRSHMLNNKNLKAHLEKRRRRLAELTSAKKLYDECLKKNLQANDRRYLQAKSGVESAKLSFHEVDKHVFEWLYILEEYKGDILDSTLQTLKYLQYEFFATSAHAISSVLPSRMEFRPMVEMTPDHLENQVDVELQEAEDAGDEEVVPDFSTKLIDKMAKDNKSKPGAGLDSGGAESGPPLPVDPLSLSSLLSQGFEEGPARRALRLHRNDTQAALDWLINGGIEGSPEVPASAAGEDRVRMPTTIKRIQKLKAIMSRQQKEKHSSQGAPLEEDKEEDEPACNSQAKGSSNLRAVEKEASEEKPTTAPPRAEPDDLLGLEEGPTADGAAAAGAAAAAGMDLLNFSDSREEPPPPTDFSKHVATAPLPEQLSFDPSRCEKPPLAASVAAGTALPRLCGGGGGDYPATASPVPTPAPAATAQEVTSQLSVAQQLAAQIGIKPEQLLLAAQQLSAARPQGGDDSGAATAAAAAAPRCLPLPDSQQQVSAGGEDAGGADQSFMSFDPLRNATSPS